MKKLILFKFFISIVSENLQSSIIISQYIETNSGTTPKGIELWNVSGSTIDFSSTNLEIKKGNNGGSPATDYTLTSGTLFNGGVIVVGTTGDLATSTTNNGGTHYTEGFTFNGDDALEVYLNGTLTDMFGVSNSDPGNSWDGNGVSTRNQNIQLKSGIVSGDTDGWTDPSTRFETVSTTPVSDQSGFGLSPGVLISGSVGFRLMSTPVSNGTYTDLLAELWTQGMTGSDAAGAADDNVWGFTLGSGAAGTWSAVSNLGATMTPGAGFLVYVFTDTDNDGDNDLPVNLSVGGSENSGNVTYPASGSIDASQYGLAGNPYSTTIDFDDVTKNNVEATVYVYDDAKSGGAGYISWNGGSGSLTNGLIAPFQGFWVQATGSGSGSIQIQEADKSTSSGTFYRMMDTEQVGSMYLEFSDYNGGYSKTWFSYRSDGEVGKDSRDAHRLMPLMATSRLAAMSFAGDQALDINNLPFDHGSDIDVPLDVLSLQLEDEQYVTGASEVSMSWNTDNLPEHIELTLTDNLTGDVVDLNNELDYTFTTEPKGSFSATYQEAVGIYPLLGDARFTLHTSYGALDNEYEVALPSVYALDPVYPNPFNPRTTVRFDVPEVSRVELEVYDITGSLVETLLDQKMVPGGHQYSWEPKSLSTGVYFLKLHTANQTFTQKVTYVK